MEVETDNVTLTDRLKKITQQKSPASAKSTSTARPNVSSSDKDLGPQLGPDWNSDDDFDDSVTTTKSSETIKDKDSSIVTEDEKKASAETATGILDFALSTIFLPIAKYQFKKKFTDEEWERVKEIQHADPAKLSKEDLNFYNKVQTLLKKHREKQKSIEMQPTECKKHERAFYVYFGAKNKKISPEWLLAMDLVTAIGSRMTEVLIDD